ncbi:MAG: hypothetical protein JRH15_16700 [Deltaproteobacteria bacterium]|nr:hypothetical protein [Deltaproteobacteria bacterium]
MNSKIIIDDPHLNDLTISLNFDIKQRKTFLTTLVTAMSITAYKTSDGRIIIRKRDTGA